MKLERGEELVSSAHIGAVARECMIPFDVTIEEVKGFRPYILPELPEFQIGLIVGKSGSGKSSLLREFGEVTEVEWSDKAIADHFDSAESASRALYAAGFNTIPQWLLSYNELSTGQKFRVDLARQLHSGAVIDEFTSVVDRAVAVSASASVGRYIRKNNLSSIVFATCHRDIIRWLSPDWVIDTDAGEIFFDTAEPPLWHKEFIGHPVGRLELV